MPAPATPAWQVPQAFEAATGHQIRDDLGVLIARDLHLTVPVLTRQHAAPLAARCPRCT